MAILLQSLSSKSETTIFLKWECDEKLDKIWYSTDGGLEFTEDSGTGNEGIIYISDLDPYTMYETVLKGRTLTGQEIIFSVVIEVQTYDYPFCSYAPDFIIGNKLNLLFYNPLGHEITVNMIGADDSIISNDTITGTHLTGFIDEITIAKLYASIPNDPSEVYRVKVTYEEHISEIEGGVYSADEELCAPTITGSSYRDTNSTTIDLTEDNQKLVRNASIPFFTATGITANNGATVSSVKVNLNETITNLTLSDSSASGYGAAVDSVTSLNAKFIVTDSRGFTAIKEQLVNIYNWFTPEALIDLNRQTSSDNVGVVNVHANYASIGGKNSLVINGYIKKSTDTEYTYIGTLTSDVDKTFTADISYDYDVKIELIDALNGFKTYDLFLPRSKPLIYFDADKYSVGINCLPTNNETLEINSEDIYSAIFYKADESFIITPDSSTNNRLYCPGMLINDSVFFSIPLPKSAKNVTPTISTLKINACENNSNYLFTSEYTTGGYNVLTSSSLTTTVYKTTSNTLTVEISSSSYISETDYSQVIVEINAIQIDFDL